MLSWGKSGGSVSGVSDVPGLEPLINRGGQNFKHVLNKVGTWGAYGASNYVPTHSPRQLVYAMVGDSTSGIGWFDSSSGAIGPRGVMRELMETSGKINQFNGSYSTTGTTWQADGSTHNYDYGLHPHGAYFHAENGSTRRSTSPGPFSGAFFPYIKEDESVAGGGTGTFELRNNSDASTISVNGVNASVSFDADAGVGADATFEKCGILYLQLDLSNCTAGQFKLSLNGLGTTVDVAYNASAATLQSALETVVGAGKAGVTLSSSVYTVLIVLDDALGVRQLDWLHGTTSLTSGGVAAYIVMKMLTGSSWVHMKMTVTSGTVRHHGFRGWDVTKNGVLWHNLGRGGARLGNFTAFPSAMASAFWADLMPDFVSVSWTHYQIGSYTITEPSTHSAYTLAQLQTNVTALIAQIEAGWTKFDMIWLSPSPHYLDTGDADLLAARAWMEPYIEDTKGYKYADTYEIVGGYADLQALDGPDALWTGDGVHMGSLYKAACMQMLYDQFHIDRWAGGRFGQTRTDIAMTQVLMLMGANGQEVENNACLILTDTTGNDLKLRPLGNNRDVLVESSAGTTKWRLSTFAGNSWIPEATKVGSTSGAVLGAVGYLAKSVAGGAGTTTLTSTESENSYYEFTGALTGNREVAIVSKPGKQIVVFNNTTGAFTLTVRPVSGTGVVVTQTKKVALIENTGLVMEAFAPEY